MTRWMYPLRFSRQAALTTIVLLTGPVFTNPLSAQRPEAQVYKVFGDDPMYTVLPPDAIPAILKPEFLSGSDGNAQMSPQEPVIGVVIGDDVRAYSMWHLDAHEIVNDTVGGKAIAVTW